MEKQTFQQGDRVVVGQASKDVYDSSRCGARGTLQSILPSGYLVVLDNADLNRSDGVWFVSQDDLTHDTNLKVGDWVRYEKVDEVGTEAWNGKIGVVTFADDDGEIYPAANVKSIADRLLQANLVKIQPPQEAHVETVKIKHGKYGMVEGVQAVGPHVWTKEHNGVLYTYLSDKGWFQIHEPEWVTIQVENQGWSKMKPYCLVYGPRGVGGNECTKWRYPQ